MIKAKQDKEIVVTAGSQIGEVAKLSKIVAERGVNILAMSYTHQGGNCTIRLVTDDNLRATDALREAGCELREEHVVVVHAAHKPGILRHITECLAKEEIEIDHLYASATIDQDTCLVVISTSNFERAVPLLNQ